MPPGLQHRRLDTPEWKVLRDARLIALRESPRSFLAKHDQEENYSQERWQAEFDRGAWFIGERDDRIIFLTGITRKCGAPAGECYLEYVWLAPDLRCQGTAFNKLSNIIGGLKKRGVRTIFLWTLWTRDGKDPARLLYKRLDFVTTNRLQTVGSDLEGRWWELLKLDLIEPRSTATDPP